MKKHLFLAAAICFAMMAQATVVIDETFNYNVANLSEAEGWTTSGTLTTGDGRTIQATPLSYTNAGGEYVLSAVGKSVKNNFSAGTNYIAYKQFTEVNSGVVYVSYLYQADGNQSQSNAEIFGISNGTSNSSLKAWAGKQSGGTSEPFRLGITRASTTSGDVQWCDDKLVSKDNVVLVVLKYDFSSQAAYLFINPEIGTTTEPAADKADTDKGTAKSSMEYLMFKHNGSSKANFYISGVRVSTTWAEAVAKKVTGLPALDAPVVGAASAIHAEDFTANWTAVENATGYTVNVYAGEDKIATKTVGDVTSVILNNMPPSTTLTYTVTALGDKENYDDSEESAKSAAFSTAVALANIITDFSDTDTWGEAAASTAEALSDQTVNGFEFVRAGLQTGGVTYEATGERFENRISIDKAANGGMVILPAVATCARVDIYASAGTENKDLKLQVYNYKTQGWSDIETYRCTEKSTCFRFTAVVDKAESTKLRIANADGSTKYIWKVVTFAAAPAMLDAPVVAEATDVSASGFTANWSAVEHASGYRVLITSADTTIRATTESEVLSLAVDQLKPETEYTVKVAAIGDDVAFVGSVLSEGKVVTTADDPTAIDELSAQETKAHKVVINGQMYIRKNGELFNMTGTKVQ